MIDFLFGKARVAEDLQTEIQEIQAALVKLKKKGWTFIRELRPNDELEIASKAAEMLGVLVEVFLENVTHQKIMIHSFQRNIFRCQQVSCPDLLYEAAVTSEPSRAPSGSLKAIWCAC